MVIRLRIENVERLANGGPLFFDTANRSFDIGREGRDWNLPDPDMFISGRHCEIRYDNGSYWLHDVSRNGTFVNGSSQRLGAPYRLQHGDRLKIGRYIVGIFVEGAVDVDQRTYSDGRGVARTDPFFGEVRPAPHPADPRGAADHGRGPQVTDGPHWAPAGSAEFLRAVAAGAGVSPEVFGRRSDQEVAREIGALLRVTVEEMAQLLKARAAAKALAKSNHRTMIGAADNNPLKFLPSAEEILEAMFARKRPGYLDAKHSVEDAFRDLKTHEIATYSAMQSALGRILDDLSPEAIEKKVPASAFSSKKTRAWEVFVATWETKEAAHENGMLDVFLAYFSEAYAKASKPK